MHLLENEESDKVQALLCIGISKLMLSGMITDDRVRPSTSVIRQEILILVLGLEESRVSVHFARDLEQSRTSTVSVVLLPGILLLFCYIPAANAEGK